MSLSAALKEGVKEALEATGIRRAVDQLSPSNRLLLRRYLRDEKVRRLHIGCGGSKLAGWLNTDHHGRRGIMALDAMRPFPIASATFDYVFSEHMIEHVPFHGGENMLRESFRVLRPGGKIRIVTPDFEFLLALRRQPDVALHKAYMEWARTSFGLPLAKPMLVINNYVRDWGHVFIYDQDTLYSLLASGGFVDIRPGKLGESDDPNLAGLEFVQRMPEGFLELESLVVEARKP
jgi:predicted SAM-dependent methyltransferase